MDKKCRRGSRILWTPRFLFLFLNRKKWTAGIKRNSVCEKIETDGSSEELLNLKSATDDDSYADDAEGNEDSKCETHDTRNIRDTFEPREEENEETPCFRCRFIFLCKFTLTILLLLASILQLRASINIIDSFKLNSVNQR